MLPFEVATAPLTRRVLGVRKVEVSARLGPLSHYKTLYLKGFEALSIVIDTLAAATQVHK
jgi:hypothetical protein